MIHIVGAGPGDPELLTLKGRRLLDGADLVVYAGSLVNDELLEGLEAELVDSHGLELEEIVEGMLEADDRGESVVRLHSGDPSIYGSIYEQMELLEEAGVEYEVVPGVSSFAASAAVLKRQLTAPEVANHVVLTRPEGRTLDEGRLDEFSGMEDVTVAIFLGISRIGEIVEELECPDDTPAAVVYRATWPEQEVIEGTVGDIAERVEEAGISRSAMILVGEALEETGARSHLYGGYARE